MKDSYRGENGGSGGRVGRGGGGIFWKARGGGGTVNLLQAWTTGGGGGRLILRLSWSFLSLILVTTNRSAPNVISPDWWNLPRTSSCLKVTLVPSSTNTMEETSPKEEKRVQISSRLACPVTNSWVAALSPDWRNARNILDLVVFGRCSECSECSECCEESF